METNLSGEPAGTVRLGSIDKRCYLFLCQSAERMETERANARAHGIQDPIDFVLELDGKRYELTYRQLRARLHDWQQLHDFWHKYALGEKWPPPSCLVCGEVCIEPAISHMELSGIVVCGPCRDASQAARTAHSAGDGNGPK